MLTIVSQELHMALIKQKAQDRLKWEYKAIT